MSLTRSERDKYTRVYRTHGYRDKSHGMDLYERYPELFDVGSCLDLGCGQGALLEHLLSLGVDAYGVDIAPNAMAKDRKARIGDRFVCACAWELSLGRRFGLVVATDFLEHIPTEKVDAVLRVIREHGDRALLKIAHFGSYVGDECLHLTVEDEGWWREKLEAVGFSVISLPAEFKRPNHLFLCDVAEPRHP